MSCSASTISTSYLDGSPYFGATAGRCANRIRAGRFELEGRRFELAVNDGPDHLHGGQHGCDKVVWTAEAMETPDGAGGEAELRLEGRRRGVSGNGDRQLRLHPDAEK